MMSKINSKQKQGTGERERKKNKLGLMESRIKFFNNHQSDNNPNLT